MRFERIKARSKFERRVLDSPGGREHAQDLSQGFLSLYDDTATEKDLFYGSHLGHSIFTPPTI